VTDTMELVEPAPAMRRPPKSLYRRLRRKVGDLLVGVPFDEALGWTLERPATGRTLDIVRFGACETREAELSHTVKSPIGWPRYLAELLGRQGIGLGWQSTWVWNLQDFPKTADELWKRRRRRRGQPDLVLVQAGGFHSLRHVIGFHRRALGLRENVGVWLGRGIRPAWRLLSVWLVLVGRRPPYPGTGQLEEFIELLRREWPDSRIAIQELFEPALEGICDRRRLALINADLADVAKRLDLDWIPRPDLGRDMGLRCANGINLNRRGSELTAAHYARWMTDHGMVD
jgi:hypothetical protein